MRTKTAAFVLKDLGLGNKPYEQNMPESVNDMMKDWTKFIPQDMDRLIINLYDFVQSFDQEEEMAWFQLSDKSELCHQFQQHLLTKSHAEMTQEERKAFLKRCCNFKVTPLSRSSAHPSIRQAACDLSDLSQLSGHFSKEEQSSLLEKAKTVLCNDQFRQGFKDSVYFVDSGGPLPHRVSALRVENVLVIVIFLGETTFAIIACLLPSILTVWQTLWRPTKAEVSAGYQQLLLQKMLVGKLHLASGIYLQLK